MNLDCINEKLSQMLPEGRIKHSIGVADCAVKLSEIYNYDKEKAYIAGIIHDCAKYLNEDEVDEYVNKYEIYLDELERGNIALSHSVIGASIARHEFLVEDKEIINAVKYHTTGREDMTLIEKIIYMADLIEEGRNFPTVDKLRELTYSGKLDEALIMSFNNTIKLIIDRGQLIHPRTVKARNYLINKK
ncbi:HD domain-containing protein [Romboutsia weinsteinii]|uniref:bis(5'-nucleosyl)-tetraphosphatase (symmetrical) n=1 Tax=Romboutsia weinsteinii TaxID=2020949 RepID=A0A371JA70_9FIRM|nr:bis(5'-nucleosyl)-tetraphosphatase (symmetrical) YqeK [Romboutsia weinsteinii]RDY29662.1 HD domain-containing protein [Romboutsia weinsteinii]